MAARAACTPVAQRPGGARRGRWLLLVIALGIALARASPAAANGQTASEPDCRDAQFHWSEGEPRINLRHVFCGELRDGRPKGFHSVRLRDSAELVRSIERRRAERGGIWSAVVAFSNGRRKLSTFFPDHCTVEQLIASIRHAFRHPGSRHPEWGEVGQSAPGHGAEMFCLDNGGAPFEIRFGVLADGRVNTAFPN